MISNLVDAIPVIINESMCQHNLWFFVSNSIANLNTFNKIIFILSMIKIIFLLCFPHYPRISFCFPFFSSYLVLRKHHSHIVSL